MLLKRKKNRHLIYIWIASMLKGGYPLIRILDTLSVANIGSRKCLRKTSHRIHNGDSFSNALKQEFPHLPYLFSPLCRVGEAHGVLPKTFPLACEMELPDQTRTEKHKLKFQYILLVLIIAGLCTLVISVFVMPVFQEIFHLMGGALPNITQSFITAVNLIKSRLLFILLGLLMLVILLLNYPVWGYRWPIVMRLTEKTPLAGNVLKYLRYWKIWYGVGSLMKFGIPLAESMFAIGEGLRMPALKALSHRISQRLSQGLTPAEAIKNEMLFQDTIEWVFETGERQDRLPEKLIAIGETYRELYYLAFSKFVAVSYIMLLCLIAAFVAWIAVALYLPVFTLAGNIAI